jgi:nucleotide-binding universal stress UspA family protein
MPRLLACVDFSPVTRDVLAHTERLARGLGAEVTLLHVAAPDPAFVGYDPGPQSVRDNVARELREEHREIEELAEALRKAGIVVLPLMVQGAAEARILEHAERQHADFIVLGSHGHGALYDLLVGSVADGVLRHARVPVVMVPARVRS